MLHLPTVPVHALALPGRLTLSSPALSRRHRAWIALYALDGTHYDRGEILRQNNVAESDIQEFFDSWFQLRARVSEVIA